MPKDWKAISDDEILNFDGPQTAEIARYERIMQQRSIDAAIGVKDKLTGLMETVYRASQGLQDRSGELLGRYDSASRSQKRQQWAIVGLTVVIAASTAAYTCITWQSVTAMREANEIQRQVLAHQVSTTALQAAPKLSAEAPANGSPPSAPSPRR